MSELSDMEVLMPYLCRQVIAFSPCLPFFLSLKGRSTVVKRLTYFRLTSWNTDGGPELVDFLLSESIEAAAFATSMQHCGLFKSLLIIQLGIAVLGPSCFLQSDIIRSMPTATFSFGTFVGFTGAGVGTFLNLQNLMY